MMMGDVYADCKRAAVGAVIQGLQMFLSLGLARWGRFVL